tara:strand:- start:1765 stop:2541 length:777 start_codon:yes stop_codon:yes gene_type:complete
MKFKFSKYQANGNDFIIFKNFSQNFPKKNIILKELCSRRFGIGADGVIFIENCEESDFKMVYYNSDGRLGSFCGNGARCSAKFASDEKIISKHTNFMAHDGIHQCRIDKNMVHLSMNNIVDIKKIGSDIIIDSGSPHYVKIVKNVRKINVFENGRKIRNDKLFRSEGINVNFVQIKSKDTYIIRTYERGVENETLSCGTGATAVAVAMHYSNETSSNKIEISSEGGKMRIEFNENEKKYSDIFLIGLVKKVFVGEIKI